MIYPNHQWWAHALFRPYLRGLCKRRFHAVHLMGDAPTLPPEIPVLLLPNHSSWWDGFFAYLLNDVLFKRRHYVMILEHSLRKLWFFQRIGGFSVNQQSPKSLLETLDFTLRLLQSSAPSVPLVVIFPQGELRPSWARPLGYSRGVERIVKKFAQHNLQQKFQQNLQQTAQSLAVIPLAICYEFLGDEKPHAFLECGAVRMIASGQTDNLPTTEELEREEEELLERLQQRITSGESGKQLL
jgi:1-acyl-sn-glycerol-3-phosphate acyltransferase